MKIASLLVLSAAVVCDLPTAQEAPLPERFSRFAGFTLWQSSLSDVAAAIGPSRPVHSGDSATSYTRLCYRAGKAFVTFASGEMGGGQLLESVVLSLTPPDIACAIPRNTSPFAKLEIDGLWLGMSMAQFKEAVPVPAKWKGARADFHYVLSSDAKAKTVVNGAGTFRSGKAVWLFINRNEQE